jgi:tetratricopeptide (TPR) repeat protein
MALGLFGVVAIAGVAALTYRPAVTRAALDRVYAENHEPLPPVRCREVEPRALTALIDAAPHLRDAVPEAQRPNEAVAALGALESVTKAPQPSAEASYFLARARAQAGEPPGAALEAAMACEDFAAADNLGAAQAVKEGRLDQAEQLAQRARRAAPTFAKPLLVQAVLQFQRGRVDAAIELATTFLTAQPESAEGHYALGLMRQSKASAVSSLGHQDEATALQAAAREAFCRAASLGHPKAQASCK